MMTISAKITVEKTGETFDTLKDWGLAIGNNDYIGEPEQETNFVNVPGASGLLDMTEVLIDRPIYKSRPLHIVLGGKNPRNKWDSIISKIRNQIDGQIVKITFSNDLYHYWRGRAKVSNYDRTWSVGTFEINIPSAEPYKYEVDSSYEPWIWDSFSFEEGIIRYLGLVEINNSEIVIPAGNMYTVPVFEIETVTTNLSVEVNGITYNLAKGKNRYPEILVGGNEDVTLKFAGIGTGYIKYRGGSL